ncbi:unnamed protein product [Diplocarpon coronariae]
MQPVTPERRGSEGGKPCTERRRLKQQDTGYRFGRPRWEAAVEHSRSEDITYGGLNSYKTPFVAFSLPPLPATLPTGYLPTYPPTQHKTARYSQTFMYMRERLRILASQSKQPEIPPSVAARSYSDRNSIVALELNHVQRGQRKQNPIQIGFSRNGFLLLLDDLEIGGPIAPRLQHLSKASEPSLGKPLPGRHDLMPVPTYAAQIRTRVKRYMAIYQFLQRSSMATFSLRLCVQSFSKGIPVLQMVFTAKSPAPDGIRFTTQCNEVAELSVFLALNGQLDVADAPVHFDCASLRTARHHCSCYEVRWDLKGLAERLHNCAMLLATTVADYPPSTVGKAATNRMTSWKMHPKCIRQISHVKRKSTMETGAGTFMVSQADLLLQVPLLGQLRLTLPSLTAKKLSTAPPLDEWLKSRNVTWLVISTATADHEPLFRRLPAEVKRAEASKTDASKQQHLFSIGVLILVGEKCACGYLKTGFRDHGQRARMRSAGYVAVAYQGAASGNSCMLLSTTARYLDSYHHEKDSTSPSRTLRVLAWQFAMVKARPAPIPGCGSPRISVSGPG